MTHRPGLKPPIDDLERRRPVWNALSTLFLDTDTSLTWTWGARVFAASEFSLDELEDISLDEVYLACGANLLSMAGRVGWHAVGHQFKDYPAFLDALRTGKLDDRLDYPH